MPVESLHVEVSASPDVLLEMILTSRWRPLGMPPGSPPVSLTGIIDATTETEVEEVTVVVETVAVVTKVDSDLGEPRKTRDRTD